MVDLSLDILSEANFILNISQGDLVRENKTKPTVLRKFEHWFINIHIGVQKGDRI